MAANIILETINIFKFLQIYEFDLFLHQSSFQAFWTFYQYLALTFLTSNLYFFLSFPLNQIVYIHNFNMNKDNRADESEEEFEIFLRSVVALQKNYLKSFQYKSKAMEDNNGRFGKQRFSRLEKQCEQYQRRIVIINAQLSWFKDKTKDLILKCKHFQEAFNNISSVLVGYLKKLGMPVQNFVQESNNDCEQYNIEGYQRFMISSLKLLSEEVKKSKDENWNGQMKKQMEGFKMKIRQYEEENQSLRVKVQLDSRVIKKYKEYIQEFESKSNKMKEEILRHQEEQKRYEEIAKNINIKTKNRSDLVILFKGLIKKQRQHEQKCQFYKVKQDEKLSAQWLQNYERQRRKHFADNKKQLVNVLNFQI